MGYTDRRYCKARSDDHLHDRLILLSRFVWNVDTKTSWSWNETGQASVKIQQVCPSVSPHLSSSDAAFSTGKVFPSALHQPTIYDPYVPRDPMPRHIDLLGRRP